MLPLRIPGATRRLAETQDEYVALSIKDTELNGARFMLSLWELTRDEAAVLDHGGHLILFIRCKEDQELLGAVHTPDLAGRRGEDYNVLIGIPGTMFPPICPMVAAGPAPIIRPRAFIDIVEVPIHAE